MRVTLGILALCALAACSTRPSFTPLAPVDPVPVGVADTCGAAPYGYLIGQDATALERVLILRQVRVIRPSDAVTEDFRPVRINFNIGADESIRTITCG
jgi:hypothetical protein